MFRRTKNNNYWNEHGRYDNGYNKEYYERGTFFDRMGSRMLNGRDRYSGRGGYNGSAHDYPENGMGYSPEMHGRRGAAPYSYYDMREAQGQQRINAMSNQHLEFDTAVLRGKYYSLDNPKSDIRDYPEREK